MAAKKTNSKKTADVGGQVVGTTTEQEAEKSLHGSDVVVLRVSLRSPHRFDDVPNGSGGTKVVVLPGLDETLRGQRQGLLTPEGNAVFFQLPRADWEAILAMHGQERMFKSYQGFPACVAEIESVVAAKKGAVKDEIEATRTGFAPIDPKAEGVTETPKGEA